MPDEEVLRIDTERSHAAEAGRSLRAHESGVFAPGLIMDEKELILMPFTPKRYKGPVD
jgi:hypothetical protein